MGRKPKYPDEEARKASRADQKRRYNESERGREARKAQNHRAHILRQAKARSPFAQWTSSHLPPCALELARQPIVVKEWDDNHDLSLGLWDAPYELTLPILRLRMLQCSVEHINFQQWGHAIDRGNERRDVAQGSDEGFNALVCKINQERASRLRQWTKDYGKHAQGGLDDALLKTGLCWSARLLAIIVLEAEICQLGREEYLKAVADHKLAWQNLNWLRKRM